MKVLKNIYKLQQKESTCQGGPLVITHHFSVTVPLRKCTCSHFLLFVWGGLALGRYWAKLEHQSAQKPRGKKRKKRRKKRKTSNTATPPARLCISPDRHAIYRYVAEVAMDGAAALKMNGDGDVCWVSDGGWRLESCSFLTPLFFLPSSLHRFRYLSYRAQTRRSEKRVADKSPSLVSRIERSGFTRLILTHEWDPR